MYQNFTGHNFYLEVSKMNNNLMISHTRKINKAVLIFLFILTLSAFIGAITNRFAFGNYTL